MCVIEKERDRERQTYTKSGRESTRPYIDGKHTVRVGKCSGASNCE